MALKPDNLPTTDPWRVAARDVLYDGRYYLGADRGLGISIENRPWWLQRFLMGHLLGIHWKDEPHFVRILGD